MVSKNILLEGLNGFHRPNLTLSSDVMKAYNEITEELLLNYLLCTYGCINNPSTVGRPFLHASVVRIDSNTEPVRQIDI